MTTPTLFPELVPPEVAKNAASGPVWIIDSEEVRFSLTFALSRSYNVIPFMTHDAFFDSVALDRPGCLITDIGTPELEDGLALQRELAAVKSPISIIFLSNDDQVETALEAMAGGAVDYLLKPVDPARLQHSVDRALALSNQKARKRRIYDLLESFTPRERQIFEKLCRGLRNSEIAEQLFLSQRTVEVHRAHFSRKMNSKPVSALLYELCLANGDEIL